jgi:hypothetical protein
VVFYVISLSTGSVFKEMNSQTGATVHICNPNYSVSENGEDYSLRPTLSKKLMRPPSQPIN